MRRMAEKYIVMQADDDELEDYINEERDIYQYQMTQETPPESPHSPSVLDLSDPINQDNSLQRIVWRGG